MAEWHRIITSPYTGSMSMSGSFNVDGNATITGNVTINGTASVENLIVKQIGYSSGSNQLGDAANDTQTLYGSVIIPTGSLTVSGSTRITGSLTQIGSSAFSGGTYTFYSAGAGDGGLRIDNTINGYNSLNWLSNTVGLGLMSGGGLFAKVSNSAGFHIGQSQNSTFVAALSVTGHGTTTSPTFVARNSAGTNILRVVDSGLVGINTAAPSASLHISGASSAVLLEIDSPAVNNILFVTGSGNVGIRTTSPSSTLDVSGSGNFTSNLTVTGSLTVSGSSTFTNIGPAVFSGSITQNASTASFGGLVGIGTNTPARTLEVFKSGLVDGSVEGVRITVNHLSATAQAALEFYHQAGPRNSRIATDIGGGGLFPSMYFYHNGSNRITITSGGNVLVGTSTNSARLTVQGSGATSSTTAFQVQNSNLSSSLAVLDNGNVGIGTTTPSFKLDVNGTFRTSDQVLFRSTSGYQGFRTDGLYSAFGYNTNEEVNSTVLKIGFAVGTSVTTLLKIDNTANSTASGPTTVLLDILANSSQTANLTQWRNSAGAILSVVNRSGSFGIGTSNPSASLHVVGNTILSGSAGTGSALTVYKSGSTVVDIQGSSGQLFSVTDSLTGSLFSVNTVAGLPVMEAFSDNTVNIGKFGVYPIKVAATGTLAIITGSFSGSLTGTALTASYVNPLVQDVLVTGSVYVSQSIYSGNKAVLGSNVNNGYLSFPQNGSNEIAAAQYLYITRTGSGGFLQIRSWSFVDIDSSLGVGLNSVTPSAQLHVRGSGATSSTTAFLVQNANASQSFKINDEGGVEIGNSSFNYSSALLTLTSNQGSFAMRVGGGSQLQCSSGISATALASNDYVQCIRILVGNGTARLTAATTDWLSITDSAQTANGSGNLSAKFGTFGTTYATINASAQVEIASTTKGLLLPRTNLTSNISAPAQGLQTYITSSATEGLYYYNSGSYQGWTKVLNDSGSQVISGSLALTGALTASSAVISGNVTVLGTASIAFLNVTYESASVIYSSGSNQLGDAADDTQLLYGTVIIPTGSLVVTGSVNITGSAGAITVGRATSTAGLVHIQKPANSTLANLYLATPYPSTTPTNIIFQNNDFGGGATGTGSISWDVGGNYFNISNRVLLGAGQTSIDLTPGSLITLSRVGAGDLQLNFLQGGVASYVIRNVSGQKALAFITDGVTATTAEAARFTANSNFLVGTTSDVARVVVKGSGATSSTTALRVENANTSSSLTVLDNGNVGIGYSSPSYLLDVSGSARISGVTYIGNDGAGSAALYTGGNVLLLAGNNNHDVQMPGVYVARSGAGFGVGIEATTYASLNSSAILTLTSTTRGLLLPRTHTTSNISSPARGLITYVTASATEGLYYYNSGSYQGWTKVINNSGSQNIAGNLTVTGSFTVTTGSLIEFQVNQNGVKIGNAATDSHSISGSVSISGSAGSGSALYAYKSGSTVLDIQGSQGQLFSVIDTLSGSLMSVNDISGLPILEVFSDDRVVMGTYGSPALTITGSNAIFTGSVIIDGAFLDTVRTGSLPTGSTLLYTINTGSYQAGFFDYYVSSGSNFRAGTIMSVAGAGTYKFTDTATPDIGNTTNLQFSMSMANANLQLYASASSAGWTVKTTFRTI